MNFKISKKHKNFISAFMALLTVLSGWPGARANTCFNDNNFPKWISPAADDFVSWTHSSTASADAVYAGGWYEQYDAAFIMRVNIDTHRTLWRRFYESPGESMNVVTALAVNPAQTALAVYGATRPGDAYSIYDNTAYIWVVRTIDGGHETNILKYVLGAVDAGEHFVHD